MSNSFEPFDFSGNNTLTDAGIRNHFKKEMEPWQPIAELIWNGLDAGAQNVRVITRDSPLGGTSSVTVLDDGKGIEFTRPLDNFRRFNDSLKKKSHSTHGSKGRGRLSFHKICAKACWFTRFDGMDAKITVESSSLSSITGLRIKPEQQNALLKEKDAGTCVELTAFTRNIPTQENLLNDLRLELGWHLAFNPEKNISLNGVQITPPEHSKTTKTIIEVDSEFRVELIQWKEKLNSEKSHTYLVGSEQLPLHHMPSSLNQKPGYYTSVVISSPWFDVLASSDETLATNFGELSTSKTWKALSKSLNKFTQEHYQDFLVSLADEQIKAFEEEGDFPEYKEFDPSYSAWRRNHTKTIVRAIILNDPKLLKNSNKRQRKIIIRLLDKISVSSENSSLLDVLESVLELSATAMDQFANQINKSKLDNIIQTIEILQKRELAIERISEIMRNHYEKTLETPDLQGVIESNTWLFGNQYESIGAEEDTFTTIAKNLRNAIKGINDVDEEDVEGEASIEGANRQVDLFLVRRQKQFDSYNQPYFRCVIIEIKRPSISLNKRHLRQIDDYAGILAKHHEFNGIKTKYEIVLVGRKISGADYDIAERLIGLSDRNDPGLIGAGPIKKYVKTWQTIIEEFRISNDFLLSNLKTRRDNLQGMTKEELVTALHEPTL